MSAQNDLAARGEAIAESRKYAPPPPRTELVEHEHRHGRASGELVDDRNGLPNGYHAKGHGRDEPPSDTKPAADDTASLPKLWRATDLKPAAQPRWLAKARIPRAAVSLVIGEEGIGKSLFWVWLCAAVSTGRALPEFGVPAREAGRVIIAAITEDDWCTAVRPRLEVAGADLDTIDVICIDEDGSGAPVYPRDLFLIAKAEPPPALVVVDAWLDTVPRSLNVKDPQQARTALHPWKDLATRTDAAVSLICHTNRAATASARDRYGATAELRKKARMCLYCQPGEDGSGLVVGPEKANGVAPIAASLFTIEPVSKFERREDDDGTVPRLVHAGQSDQTAREHFADAYAAGRDTETAADVVAFLGTALAGGPRWADGLRTEGEVLGHTIDQLKRAKRKLHVQSVRDGTANAWYWRLEPPR